MDPSASIDSVDAGESVTVTARNFPPDTAVDVFIGVPGNEGVDGEYVDTTDSGSGTFTATYKIPNQYADEPQLVTVSKPNRIITPGTLFSTSKL